MVVNWNDSDVAGNDGMLQLVIYHCVLICVSIKNLEKDDRKTFVVFRHRTLRYFKASHKAQN